MLLLVLRKMLNNKWMVLCLLIGSVIVVAIVSGIPVYSDGVLQRMLTRDLEALQQNTANYPGMCQISTKLYNITKKDKRVTGYLILERKVEEDLLDVFELPLVSRVHILSAGYLSAVPVIQQEEILKKRDVAIKTLLDIEKHIRIARGRMPARQPDKNGTFEVIVTEEALKKLDVMLDRSYTIKDTNNKSALTVKVVGVFAMKELRDTYWSRGLSELSDSFIMDFNLFNERFIRQQSPLLTDTTWRYAFDYHSISINNAAAILAANDSMKRWFDNYRDFSKYEMLSAPILEKYQERYKQLKMTLWVLLAPILLMIAFYIFMVSQIILGHDANEIAVLTSRGASRVQIFTGYLLECVIICIIALAAGPFLGLLMCRIIGATNGFLEFVQRSGLPLSLNINAYVYAIGALILFTMTMLLPAFLYSRTTIVWHKQRKVGRKKTAAWQKFYLDVQALAIAFYGLYSYYENQKILSITGIKGTELGIDPLLFLISTLFIVGAGLLFLRFFPYIIRLVFLLGRSIWSPVFYASFIQIGRSGGQEQFLMLFIILTLSIGIFNANAARTINKNIDDKIRYETGADIALKPLWDSNKPAAVPTRPGIANLKALLSANEPVIYIEPSFEPYTELPDIDEVTRVFIHNSSKARAAGKDMLNVTVMGIIPNEFGKVAWFRNDLLPFHWYNYLNLMAESPAALLVSSNMKKTYNVKEGDELQVTWEGQNYLSGVVYAFVDYWPGYNPYAKDDEGNLNCLVVCNYPYLRNQMTLEPYEIWLRKKSGASDELLYKDIELKKLQMTGITSANQELIKKKNDPLLQGTNGVLTLGFVVTIIISSIGFLIYWIFSIKNRILQFGIFRAMGLTLAEIIGILLCEQVLISGTAILTGIVIGGIASDLYVPLLQLVYSTAEQVPPFKVTAYADDYVRLYTIMGLMLLTGFIVLGTIVSRIKIDQALKLGED